MPSAAALPALSAGQRAGLDGLFSPGRHCHFDRNDSNTARLLREFLRTTVTDSVE
jgi:hypothetical protein